MSQAPCFRRKVFYLSGYDPRGARFYHQLHAEQAAIYAANSGQEIAVGERRRAGGHNSAWTVENGTENALTEFEVLGWDDLIRKSWSRNPALLFRGAVASTLSFTLAWDWRRYARHIPRATFIAFYYPALTLVVLPVLLIALIWLAAGPLVAILLGLALTYLFARRVRSMWLLRFLIFNDRLARRGPTPELEERLNEMAERIEAALGEDWDEVLFVTHSNGSILAVPVMERLLARHGGTMPDNFALMTLGSCIPLVGIRRDAARFNAQLTRLAEGEFLWLDLGSPTDGACIPLVDPCLTCGTGHRPRLHVLSPRWFRYCDPATYARRRRDKYQTHFEYLRSFERISPLDYVRVTSCAAPLASSIEAFAREPK